MAVVTGYGCSYGLSMFAGKVKIECGCINNLSLVGVTIVYGYGYVLSMVVLQFEDCYLTQLPV